MSPIGMGDGDRMGGGRLKVQVWRRKAGKESGDERGVEGAACEMGFVHEGVGQGEDLKRGEGVGTTQRKDEDDDGEHPYGGN